MLYHAGAFLAVTLSSMVCVSGRRITSITSIDGSSLSSQEVLGVQYQSPLRPVRSPSATMSLLQQLFNGTDLNSTSNSREECTSTYRSTERGVLGKGRQGTVKRVLKTANKLEYALKSPNSKEDVNDLIAEAKIMQAAAGCEGVMQVRDLKPCYKRRYVPGMYVTDRMEGDLQAWLTSTKGSVKEGWTVQDGLAQRRRCKPDFEKEMLSALDCLHGKGFIHGDLKLDNVLYNELGEDGCPTGLRLADFGLSAAIGTELKKYPKECMSAATHLPDCVFEGQPCNLPDVEVPDVEAPLSDDVFVVDPLIDMCSYKVMRSQLFQEWTPLDAKYENKGSCGKMAYGRGTEFRFP